MSQHVPSLLVLFHCTSKESLVPASILPPAGQLQIAVGSPFMFLFPGEQIQLSTVLVFMAALVQQHSRVFVYRAASLSPGPSLSWYMELLGSGWFGYHIQVLSRLGKKKKVVI